MTIDKAYIQIRIETTTDPEHQNLNADPDPAFHFNADPELSFHYNSDDAPYPSDLLPLVYRPSRAPFWASKLPLWASTALHSSIWAFKGPEYGHQCGSGSSFQK